MMTWFLLLLFGYYAVQLFLLWIPLMAVLLTRRTHLSPLAPLDSVAPSELCVVIPCRDGCEFLPSILTCLAKQSYPRENFKVWVLADNCSDDTASVARRMGVNCYERINSKIKTKGAALNEFLSAQLKSELFDGLTILDVDSVVSPEFLACVAEDLRRGARVTQAMFVSKNPDQSGLTQVGEGAQALIRINQLGRRALGLSAHLLGSGITIRRDVLEQLDWHLGTGRHLTEDLELGIRCYLNNIPIRFAPDQRVVIDLPAKSKNILLQRRRWSAGPIEITAAYAWPIFKKIFSGDWRILEATLSLLLSPPYSIFWCLWGMLTLFLFLQAGRWSSPVWAGAAGVLWISQGLYYLVGLKAGGANLKSLTPKNILSFVALRILGVLGGIRLTLTRQDKDRWIPTSSKSIEEETNHGR